METTGPSDIEGVIEGVREGVIDGVGVGDITITELLGDGVGVIVNIGVGARKLALYKEFCTAPKGIYFI
jgi:hypothetical protein